MLDSTVIVNNLPSDLTAGYLKIFAEAWGDVRRVELLEDGSGLVEFESETAAKDMVTAQEDCPLELLNKSLFVKMATPDDDTFVLVDREHSYDAAAATSKEEEEEKEEEIPASLEKEEKDDRDIANSVAKEEIEKCVNVASETVATTNKAEEEEEEDSKNSSNVVKNKSENQKQEEHVTLRQRGIKKAAAVVNKKSDTAGAVLNHMHSFYLLTLILAGFCLRDMLWG